MRKIVVVSALSVLAAGAVAAGVYQMRTPSDAMTADLERDLSLATSVPQTRASVVSALEQGRTGGPSGTEVGQRALVVTKKRAPSSAPSPTVVEVAAAPPVVAPEPAKIAEPEVAPPLITTSPSPSPSSTATDVYPPDLSYPTPASGPSASSDADRGANNGDAIRTRPIIHTTGEILSTTATAVGAILRGGAAGHDNCEPPGRRNGLPQAAGVLGQLGGAILNGGAVPRGTQASGPMPSAGRARW